MVCDRQGAKAARVEEDQFQQKANDLFRRSLEAAALKRRQHSDPAIPATPKTTTRKPLVMPAGGALSIVPPQPAPLRHMSVPMRTAAAAAPPMPYAEAEELPRSPMRRHDRVFVDV